MTLQHPLYHMSLSYFAQLLPPLRLRDDCEHHLGDVERVPPVVVGEAAVVLLHRAQPAAQDGVVDVEPPRKVHVDEHPQRRLQKLRGHKNQSCFHHQGLNSIALLKYQQTFQQSFY